MAMKVRYTVVDGEVLSELRDGVKRDYVPDPLGSTVALLDSSQNITDTFSYWPYGESAGRTGTTATPFQFVGNFGYYQDGIGRNYVRARYLDKGKGRWIAEDPIGIYGGDTCFYRYVKNQVITSIDRSGYQGIIQFPTVPIPPFPPSTLDPFKPVLGGDPPEPNHTNYCGNNKVCPLEGVHSDPVDCIDIACAAHDRCLYRYQVGNPLEIINGYFFCASGLCARSTKCLEKGCNSSVNPQGCRWVARWIQITFCTFSLVPAVPPFWKSK